MPVPQQKFRELVFQILFSYDVGTDDDDDGIVSLMMEQLSVSRKEVNRAIDMVRAVMAEKNNIDTIIGEVAVDYDFERIQRAERNILRLALYEILHCKLPLKIAISEAIRLCRKFSTAESASFVNAILDDICRTRLSEEPNI